MNPQLKKGVLELCVLSQLTDGDKYGYELTELISREMSLAAGTLYMILKRLKEEQYVDTYLVESDSGPARKYYHLTEKGYGYLEEKSKEWQAFTEMVDRLTRQRNIPGTAGHKTPHPSAHCFRGDPGRKRPGRRL